MENWLGEKDEFSSRHQTFKSELNNKYKFFTNGIYYRVNDKKFTGMEVSSIYFYYNHYSVNYISKSADYKMQDSTLSNLVITYICSYDDTAAKELSEYFGTMEEKPVNREYSKVSENDIEYTVSQPTKDPTVGVRITWIQNEAFFSATFKNISYSPELIDYCVAQKVDLNSTVK